jgi:aspartate aminotransferase-like enzyme
MPPIKRYLFTPGPVPVPPEVLLEVARPVIHHRTAEFGAVLDQARDRLKPLFGTAHDVIILSASGTGAMEAAIVNVLSPGDHAVFVNGGKFGERWGKMLAAHGMLGHEIAVEWGRAVRPEQIDDALRANPAARAVFVQASETSTTAVHPIDKIGQVTRSRDVMLVVDGITSVGVFEQKMDAWGIDALITGSQKALMTPPGLGIIALSPRAVERAEASKSPRFYFDLPRELQSQRAERTTAYTASVSLVFGLNKALELIHAETLPRVFARHRLMAESVRDAAAALGLRLLAPDNPAPGVTGVLLPDSVDGSKLIKYARDVLGVHLQGGQDRMKGRLVRFGHMGWLSPFDMLTAVSAFELALAECGHRFDQGAGVAAVHRRIARGI